MKKHSLLFLILLSIVMTTQAQSPEQKLQQLGITLPVPSKPVATYVNAVRTGNLIYLSGKGPTNADGTDITGKLGKDLSIEQGYAAAKSTGINLLAALKAEIGSLDKVKRIVRFWEW
jgi:enamine deaminase RidA (YjgF/YER057c/UK114 family)